MFCAMALLILLYFLPYRVKTKQRKAVVTTVDKKIPNGILEEQGKIVKQIVDIENDQPAVKRSICETVVQKHVAKKCSGR